MGDNSMETTLSLDTLFTVTAGQTYTYEILGESVSNLTADESITLEVPKATMDKLLAYSSNWDSGREYPGYTGATGAQPSPAVTLRLKSAVGAWLDALSHGLTGATDGASYAADSQTKYTVYGDASTSVNTLLYHFQQIASFAYTEQGGVTSTNYLDVIPVEAIQSFQRSPVSMELLSNVTGDIVVIPAAGALGSDADPLKAAVQGLFEQAVAEPGMVLKDGLDDLSGETLVGAYANLGAVEQATNPGSTVDPVYGVQWAADQTLGMFVQFDLVKRRKYELSTELSTANAGTTASISYGGVEFELAGELEVSSPISKTYQIVLKAVADPA
jgi:hypothetical protein